MKNHLRTFVFFIGISLWIAAPLCGQTSFSPSKSAESLLNEASRRVSFERNDGQFPGGFGFSMKSQNLEMRFSENGIDFGVFNFSQNEEAGNKRPLGGKAAASLPCVESYGWNMKLDGASPNLSMVAKSPIGGRTRYFEQDKPVIEAARFNELWYEKVYPGIDLRFYGAESNELEYDFVVQPDGDPRQVSYQLNGLQSLKLLPSGELSMRTSLGEIKKSRPVAYQLKDGQRAAVECGYLLKGNHVQFEVGEYDRSRPLIIDPVILMMSTFIGGSGFESVDQIKVNSVGEIVLTGTTTSPNFPQVGMAYPLGADVDLGYSFVLKISADGSQVLWTDFFKQTGSFTALEIGGGDDIYALAPHSGATPYILGTAFQQAQPRPTCAFLMKLGNNGTPQWSTFVAGSSAPEEISAIDWNPVTATLGIAGYTVSPDFPVSPDAFQPVHSGNGSADGVLLVVNGNGGFVSGSYIGNLSEDYMTSIGHLSDGDWVLGGGSNGLNSSTLSLLAPNEDFQYISAGTYQTARPVAAIPRTTDVPDFFLDAVVLRIGSDGKTFKKGTFLRNETWDYITGLRIVNDKIYAHANGYLEYWDAAYDPHAANGTPTSPGAFIPWASIDVAGFFFTTSQFHSIVKLDNNLTTVEGHTYVPLEVRAFDVSPSEDIMLVGARSEPIPFRPTADALQTSTKGNYEVQLSVLNGFTKQSYATYLGSPNSDHGVDINYHDCKIYLAGSTEGRAFPVTPTYYDVNGILRNAVDATFNTPAATDGFVSVFSMPQNVANTLAAFAPGTTFCIGSSIPSINGNTPSPSIPNIRRFNTVTPQTVVFKYKWEVSTTGAAGPWADVPGVFTEDFIPNYNSTAGSRWYRRLIQQQLGDAITCHYPPSNAVEVAIDSRKAALADAGGNVAICAGTPITLSGPITHSDEPGAPFFPYNFTWAPTAGLIAPTSGTITTIGQVPSVQTNTSQSATYTLQITDNRGCVNRDQVVISVLKADAGVPNIFTCTATSLTLGPSGPPAVYDNIPATTYNWTPSTGLSCTNCLNPVLSVMPPPGGTAAYHLEINGCASSGDDIVVHNDPLPAVPAMPGLTMCQGDTVVLGGGSPVNPGYAYQWAPLLFIENTDSLHTKLIASTAPSPTNNYVYTLTVIDKISGCTSTGTQNVTVYRAPTNSFKRKFPWCPEDTHSFNYQSAGTPAEAGATYSWQAFVEPSGPGNGIPTPAQALNYITSATAPLVTFYLPGWDVPNGGLADVPVNYVYVRTSANPAFPQCLRRDTMIVYYQPGTDCIPGGCELDLGAGTGGYCASPTTVIGPVNVYSQNVNYIWSPVTGLKDPVTNLPLPTTGPHPARVIANPAATTTYTLTTTNAKTGWTCSVDATVFVATSTIPTLNYDDKIACANLPITIGGPTAAGFNYLWSPSVGLSNPNISNPVFNFDKSKNYSVKLIDPVSGCFTTENVAVLVEKIKAFAGDDAQFCTASGVIAELGSPALPDHSYQWILPTSGLFNTTSAQTKDTIYSTTSYVVSVTDNSTGCTGRDTVVFTGVAVPSFNLGDDIPLCSGGSGTIGLAPNPAYTYAWTSSSPGNGLDPGSASSAMPAISPTGAGPWVYSGTVALGNLPPGAPACMSAADNVTVTPATLPAYPTSVSVPCAGTDIGPDFAGSNVWYFEWMPTEYTNNSTGSQLHVAPPVATTFHFSATAPGGCTVLGDILATPSCFFPQLEADMVLCKGASPSPTLQLLNAASLPPGAIISWAGNTGPLSSTTIVNPVFNLNNAAPGVYELVFVVRVGADFNTDNLRITVGQSSSGLAGLDQSVCVGDCIQIGAPATTNTEYLWTVVPYAEPNLLQLNDLTIANPTACMTIPGATTFKLNTTDPVSGCTSEDFVTIQANEAAPSLLVQGLSFCQNPTSSSTADLNAAIVSTNGINPTFWYDPTAQFAPVPMPTAVGSGIYYVKMTNATGRCETVRPVQIDLKDHSAASVFSANATCSGMSFSMNNGSILASGFAASERFAFSAGAAYSGAATYATATAIPPSGVLTASLPNPATSQQYTVRLFSANGCTQDYTVALQSQLPVLTARDTAVCAGAMVNLATLFSENAVNGTVSYYETAANALAGLSPIPAMATVNATDTFFVRKINGGGCFDVDTIRATVAQPDLLARDTTVCANSPVNLATLFSANAVAGTVAYFANFANAQAGSPTILAMQSPGATTEFFVKKMTALGCSDIDSMDVTVNALPTIAATTSVCINSTITLTGSGTPASTNPYVSSSTALATVTGGGVVTGVAAGMPTITYTDNHGCTATSVVTSQGPTVAAPANQFASVGTPAFTLGGGTPTGGTYSGTGVSGGSFDPATAGAGAHTITYSFTDINGCSNTSSFSISVSAVAAACPANQSACVNGSAFSLSGGTPAGGTYSGTGVSGGVFTPATAGVGMHTITYSYTDGNATTTTCTFVITVNALPVVACPANQSVCAAAAAFALSGATPAGGAYSGTGISGGMFDPAVAGAGVHTVSYSYTNGNNCTNTCTFTVTVDAPPTLVGGSVCVNSTTTLTGSGTPAALNPYISSNPAVATVTGVGLVTGVSAGSVTVTFTNNNGCTATASVTVNPLPTVAITGATNICFGTNSLFTASGGSTYLWDTGANTPSITVSASGTYTVTATTTYNCSASISRTLTVCPAVVAGISGNNSICAGANSVFTASGGTSYLWGTGATTPAIAVSAAGAYSVTVMDGNGCTAVATRTLTVNSLPTAAISAPAETCATMSMTFTASGGTSYLWSNGPATPATTAPTAGTYTVTVMDGNGCTATASHTLNPLPNAAIAGQSSTCAGSSSVFTASGGSSYLWSTAETTPAITASAAGPYSVTVTNGFNCTATATKTLSINPNPAVDITGLASICDGTSTTYTANGGSTYQWSTGQTTQSITVAASGTYSVTVSDGNNCMSMSAQSLTLKPAPGPAVCACMQSFCATDNPVLSSLSPSGPDIVWYSTPSGSLPLTNLTMPLSNGSNFYVVQRSADGCESIIKVHVMVSVVTAAPGHQCIGGCSN